MVGVIFLLYKIGTGNLQMGAVVYVTCWFVAVCWSVVVRQTVGFLEAVQFVDDLASSVNTSDRVIFQSFFLDFRIELYGSAVDREVGYFCRKRNNMYQLYFAEIQVNANWKNTGKL